MQLNLENMRVPAAAAFTVLEVFGDGFGIQIGILMSILTD